MPSLLSRTSWKLAILASLGLALTACGGGGVAPDYCSVSVLKIEKFKSRPGAVDIGYRVKGEAGSEAIVSLVAKKGSQDYITGQGVRVGPGPFLAIVELELTAVPPEFIVLLEVNGRRCSATAPRPG